ncbi:MAG: F-box protein [Waddliaceae bacterium]
MVSLLGNHQRLTSIVHPEKNLLDEDSGKGPRALPDDVLNKILLCLPFSDYPSVVRVSHQYRNLTYHCDSFWKEHVRRLWKCLATIKPKSSSSCKDIFIKAREKRAEYGKEACENADRCFQDFLDSGTELQNCRLATVLLAIVKKKTEVNKKEALKYLKKVSNPSFQGEKGKALAGIIKKWKAHDLFPELAGLVEEIINEDAWSDTFYELLEKCSDTDPEVGKTLFQKIARKLDVRRGSFQGAYYPSFEWLITMHMEASLAWRKFNLEEGENLFQIACGIFEEKLKKNTWNQRQKDIIYFHFSQWWKKIDGETANEYAAKIEDPQTRIEAILAITDPKRIDSALLQKLEGMTYEIEDEFERSRVLAKIGEKCSDTHPQTANRLFREIAKTVVSNLEELQIGLRHAPHQNALMVNSIFLEIIEWVENWGKINRIAADNLLQILFEVINAERVIPHLKVQLLFELFESRLKTNPQEAAEVFKALLAAYADESPNANSLQKAEALLKLEDWYLPIEDIESFS